MLALMIKLALKLVSMLIMMMNVDVDVDYTGGAAVDVAAAAVVDIDNGVGATVDDVDEEYRAVILVLTLIGYSTWNKLRFAKGGYGFWTNFLAFIIDLKVYEIKELVQ